VWFEGEHGAGRARLVGVVEVVHRGSLKDLRGVVEQDRLLHEAQAEDPRVKIEVFLRIVGVGRDVVNAGYRVAHGSKKEIA
jgi:hypothetical protein